MRLPARLLRRKKDTSKNDFGQVFIIAGSPPMLGAASLAAKAALRSGAGLVSIGVAKGLNGILQKKLSDEIMTKPLAQTKEGTISLGSFPGIKKFAQKVDAVAVGPGMSRQKSTQALIRKIISRIDLPMVIDADALNALAGHLDLLRNTPALPAGRRNAIRNTRILTPHLGEMARLLKTSPGAIQKQRKDIAKVFAKKYNCIVVLKGDKTVVADSKGKVYINQTGNPGMATAGSGDVLTGILAAFLGQGLAPFEAAKYAVYLHGLAGDLAAKAKTQLGMIASDIIDKIPVAIKKCS